MNILIVEDDLDLNKNIKAAFDAENYHTTVAYDGQIAQKLMKQTRFDCIILDINLPNINGYELCKTFREFDKNTPIILLTALGELEDKVEGYNKGADDYLTKPFYMKELILRVNSLIKRKNQSQADDENSILLFDDIILDTHQKTIKRAGKNINLTLREFQIIQMLLEQNGDVVSKQRMLQDIWNTSSNVNSNTIEVYVNFLRNKIDKPFGKSTIKTKVGFGYYLE